jgi:putative ABC transport system substrate-binding protein
MRRREFITVLGGAAASPVLWALAARAQQPAVPVVGFLHVGSADPFAHLVAGFRQGLKETGFVEGQNVAVEFRWADGRYDRLPALAADLARRQVAVILTGGGEPSIFAVRATSATIPIVFNIGSDPVRLGIVASLGRPGGSATGVNILSVELAAKRLGLLNDLMPKDSMSKNSMPKDSAFAFLVNPNFPPTATNVEQVEAAGRSIGRQFLLLKASSENEIDAAFTTIAQVRAGAPIRSSSADALRSWRQWRALAFRRCTSSASSPWPAGSSAMARASPTRIASKVSMSDESSRARRPATCR